MTKTTAIPRLAYRIDGEPDQATVAYYTRHEALPVAAAAIGLPVCMGQFWFVRCGRYGQFGLYLREDGCFDSLCPQVKVARRHPFRWLNHISPNPDDRAHQEELRQQFDQIPHVADNGAGGFRRTDLAVGRQNPDARAT